MLSIIRAPVNVNPQAAPNKSKKRRNNLFAKFWPCVECKEKIFFLLKIKIFIISSQKTFFDAFFVGDDQIWSIL